VKLEDATAQSPRRSLTPQTPAHHQDSFAPPADKNSSTSQDAADIRELEQSLARLERRSMGFWLLSAALLLAFTVSTAVLYTYTQTANDQPWHPVSESTLLSALGGLVLVFLFYMFLKQQELVRLRGEALRRRIDATSLETSLKALIELMEASAELKTGDGRRTTESIVRSTRTAFRAVRAALYIAPHEGPPFVLVSDPPPSRTHAPPEWDAYVRRACETRSALTTARGVVRAYLAGTMLIAPFVAEPRSVSDTPDGDTRTRRSGAAARPTANTLGASQLLALLVARDPRETPFSEHEKQILAAYVRHVASALERPGTDAAA
jgi:hypothetical protein